MQGQRVKTCGTSCASGQGLVAAGPLHANRHPLARDTSGSSEEGDRRDFGLVHHNYLGAHAAVCTD